MAKEKVCALCGEPITTSFVTFNNFLTKEEELYHIQCFEKRKEEQNLEEQVNKHLDLFMDDFYPLVENLILKKISTLQFYKASSKLLIRHFGKDTITEKDVVSEKEVTINLPKGITLPDLIKFLSTM
jgi:hypothetical protein